MLSFKKHEFYKLKEKFLDTENSVESVVDMLAVIDFNFSDFNNKTTITHRKLLEFYLFIRK
jgi:hypothetical protein